MARAKDPDKKCVIYAEIEDKKLYDWVKSDMDERGMLMKGWVVHAIKNMKKLRKAQECIAD